MNVLVDTSVWSLAFRHDRRSDEAALGALAHALEAEEIVVATGLILQELLQGFAGPKARSLILDRFSAVPLVVPDRDDHVQAAELHNRCRRAGRQIGTIDALLAQLCLRHDLTMLTTDRDFRALARHSALKLWKPSG